MAHKSAPHQRVSKTKTKRVLYGPSISLRNCMHGWGTGEKRRNDVRKDGPKKTINGEQRRRERK
jgi:hypothetical protein